MDRGDLKMIYATRYCATDLNGYFYLPGPSELQYRDNSSTIMRGEAEGKWYPATPGWNSLLSDALATRDQPCNLGHAPQWRAAAAANRCN